MKMKLQYQYKIEEFAYLLVLDAKHGKHHVEWSEIYPWLAECDTETRDNVLYMLNDIAAAIKSTQTLLNKQVQEEKMNYVYPGQGSEWNKSTLGGS